MASLRRNSGHRTFPLLLAVLAGAVMSGCYAPLHSPGIPASQLPESFRIPIRSPGPELNFAELTLPPAKEYRLGPNDVLEVTVPPMFDKGDIVPVTAEIMGDGMVQLPLLGSVDVNGLTIGEAQQKIDGAYADGFFVNPRVTVRISDRAKVNVLVLGQVNAPGIFPLPKYENDIGHALGAAGGLNPDAGEWIEVHRRVPAGVNNAVPIMPVSAEVSEDGIATAEELPFATELVLRIPIRGPYPRSWPQQDAVMLTGGGYSGGGPGLLTLEDITLQPGDVVLVPQEVSRVFYVVGQLDRLNQVNFRVTDKDRELGAGFLIPPNRDIDVVTAVTMAGYLDPIDSPTTVTVHRRGADGQPMLILVDMIKARYDRRETVIVQPGDIIYVNPDGHWWFRRTFDRIVPDLLLIPYARATGR